MKRATLDYLPEGKTAALLWSASVHLITMQPGWQGVIVPSKLYGVLKTSAPVLFVGPEDAETSIEIIRLGRGQQVRAGAGGATVVNALDQLSAHPRHISIMHDQTATMWVARFIAA